MPLSKRRNRDRMRVSRATPAKSKVVQPHTPTSVQPVIPNMPSFSVIPDMPNIRTLPKIEGLVIEGNKITGVTTERPPSREVPPIYNWQLHKPGDRVRVWQGNKWVETIVPLDDGSPLESSPALSPTSSNIFKPAFNPAPKPARRPSSKVKTRHKRT